MTKPSIRIGVLAVLSAMGPSLAVAETAVLPRPKPEISAATAAAIDEAGTATVSQPAGVGQPAGVPAVAVTLETVLTLSDKEIIETYGIGSNLSHDAELIVATVAATSDINTACRDRESLRAAMEPVVKGLKDVGKIQGKLWPKAFEAGKYMYVNCGQMVTTSAVN